MAKSRLGLALAALLLAITTVESSASMRRYDWPNGGTCVDGPKAGKFVRDLKFCHDPAKKAKKARQTG